MGTKMQVNKYFGYLLAIICIATISCKTNYEALGKKQLNKVNDTLPHYEQLAYWAAHPAIKDPSDSIPADLKNSYKADTSVNVFFIYPTIYSSKEMEHGWNASLTDATLNAKIDYTTILSQASVFNQYPIYAPRYRQAHLSAYYTADSVAAIAAFELAYNDVKTSFEYFLKRFNKGKPFIIASHSQGTTHARRLVKEMIDDKPLAKLFVTGYLVGIPVPEKLYSKLQPCTTPTQIGCLCSWRTYRDAYETSFVQAEKEKMIITNPLTWNAAKPNATREENAGAILRNYNKLVENVIDANVHNNVIWTGKPHFFGSFLLKTKNYHIADYNFYYLSIKNNASERVKAYFEQNK
jgi:hypothetical protein